MNSIVLPKAHNCPVFDEKQGPFAIYYENEQITKIENDDILPIKVTDDELDLLILSAILKLKITTSLLLEKMLRHIGTDDEIDQKLLQKRLRVLSASEFLTAYRFESTTNSGSRSSHKVYTLGWRGAGLLRAKGQAISYLRELSSPEFAKQLLSAVQYVVNSGTNIDDFEIFSPLVVPRKDGSKKKSIYPRAIVRAGTETIFVEPVRQSENWKEELLKTMRDFSNISLSKEHNIPFQRNRCTLLLIAENTAHMKKIMEIVDSHYLLYPVKICFSCDTLTYSNPENCVYSLKSGFLASLFSA